MEEKIVAKIAAYLEKETNVKYGFLKIPERVEFGGSLNPGHFTHTGFCQEIAAEIAKSIQSLVDEEAQAFAGWIANQVIAGRTYDKLWLDYKVAKKYNL